MDSPNFEGFHAQLDCIFTYGSKNKKKKTDTRIVCIVSCTGKTNTERNNKKQ